MYPGSPRIRSQWGPWFALAVCFLAASVLYAKGLLPLQPSEGWKAPGAWKTFVLTRRFNSDRRFRRFFYQSL